MEQNKMEARELNDDELVDVTGGDATAKNMYKRKYYEIFKSMPYGFTMDNVNNVYKMVSNMYKEDCMGNDLTPEERNEIFHFIQNLNRMYQSKATTYHNEFELYDGCPELDPHARVYVNL